MLLKRAYCRDRHNRCENLEVIGELAWCKKGPILHGHVLTLEHEKVNIRHKIYDNIIQPMWCPKMKH